MKEDDSSNWLYSQARKSWNENNSNVFEQESKGIQRDFLSLRKPRVMTEEGKSSSGERRNTKMHPGLMTKKKSTNYTKKNSRKQWHFFLCRQSTEKKSKACEKKLLPKSSCDSIRASSLSFFVCMLLSSSANLRCYVSPPSLEEESYRDLDSWGKKRGKRTPRKWTGAYDEIMQWEATNIDYEKTDWRVWSINNNRKIPPPTWNFGFLCIFPLKRTSAEHPTSNCIIFAFLRKWWERKNRKRKKREMLSYPSLSNKFCSLTESSDNVLQFACLFNCLFNMKMMTGRRDLEEEKEVCQRPPGMFSSLNDTWLFPVFDLWSTVSISCRWKEIKVSTPFQAWLAILSSSRCLPLLLYGSWRRKRCYKRWEKIVERFWKLSLQVWREDHTKKVHRQHEKVTSNRYILSLAGLSSLTRNFFPN